MPKLTGLLTAYSSTPDSNGNTYWALRFIDFETGTTVHGRVCGGLSNIQEIIKNWGTPGEWDESIMFEHITMTKTVFKHLTSGWLEAGCRSEDLAAFIKGGIIHD